MVFIKAREKSIFRDELHAFHSYFAPLTPLKMDLLENIRVNKSRNRDDGKSWLREVMLIRAFLFKLH